MYLQALINIYINYFSIVNFKVNNTIPVGQ